MDFNLEELEEAMKGPFYSVPDWVKCFEDFEKWMEMISSGEIQPDEE